MHFITLKRIFLIFSSIHKGFVQKVYARIYSILPSIWANFIIIYQSVCRTFKEIFTSKETDKICTSSDTLFAALWLAVLLHVLLPLLKLEGRMIYFYSTFHQCLLFSILMKGYKGIVWKSPPCGCLNSFSSMLVFFDCILKTTNLERNE